MSGGGFGSAARYEDERRAIAYAARSPRRSAAEVSVIERLLDDAGHELGSTLDAPCGAARLGTLLTRRGARWVGLDASASMLALARARNADGPLVLGSVDRLPFADRSFDTVCCFRFLHHLPPPQQEVALAELARVARTLLIVSGFHPVSAHGVWRRARSRLRRRPAARHATAPRTADAVLGREGLLPGARRRQGPLRELWIGLWLRADAGARRPGGKGAPGGLLPR